MRLPGDRHACPADGKDGTRQRDSVSDEARALHLIRRGRDHSARKRPGSELLGHERPLLLSAHRFRRKSDYAIFGGNDHKTGQETQPDACFGELAALLHDLIPDAKIDRQWSGQVIETHDGLPYIGETADRQFVATGFSGNGMTFGTLAAMMACDAVLGTHQPVAGLVLRQSQESQRSMGLPEGELGLSVLPGARSAGVSRGTRPRT